MKAMIFAAGLGTRFKPWTDKHPKALALVNGKTLLQRNVEYLQQYKIADIVVNVHHFGQQVVDLIDKNKGWGSRIRISDERREILETGGGLKKAAPFLDKDPFVLINVDILTDLDLGAMILFHQSQHTLATLAVADRKSSRHFLFDEHNVLCGWQDSRSGLERIVRPNSGLVPKAFSGIHILEPAIFPKIRREGKFSMVDLYLDLAPVERIQSYDQGNSKWVDVGRPETLSLAENLFP